MNSVQGITNVKVTAPSVGYCVEEDNSLMIHKKFTSPGSPTTCVGDLIDYDFSKKLLSINNVDSTCKIIATYSINDLDQPTLVFTTNDEGQNVLEIDLNALSTDPEIPSLLNNFFATASGIITLNYSPDTGIVTIA